MVVIGKTTTDNDKEDYNNDVDDDDVDNAENPRAKNLSRKLVEIGEFPSLCFL